MVGGGGVSGVGPPKRSVGEACELVKDAVRLQGYMWVLARRVALRYGYDSPMRCVVGVLEVMDQLDEVPDAEVLARRVGVR